MATELVISLGNGAPAARRFNRDLAALRDLAAASARLLAVVLLVTGGVLALAEPVQAHRRSTVGVVPGSALDGPAGSHPGGNHPLARRLGITSDRGADHCGKLTVLPS
jgi:hypothetical protein